MSYIKFPIAILSYHKAAEWEEQGRKLFANKRYRQSKHCFERAFLPQQVAMAGAYYLRAEARNSPGGSSRRAVEARRTAFLEAATAFVNCARETSTLAYFRIAAECFEDAGEDLSAAQNYQDAKEYTRSAELYRKLGRFDEAVDIVKNHKAKIRPEVVANVTNVARLFYFKEHKLEYVGFLNTIYSCSSNLKQGQRPLFLLRGGVGVSRRPWVGCRTCYPS